MKDLNELAIDPESTAEMEITDAAGSAMRDEDGNSYTISFRPPNSSKVLAAQRRALNRRMKQRGTADAEQIEAEQLEELVAATAGWRLPPVDGVVLPFSESAARRLFADERYMRLRRQALAFQSDFGNFTSGSSTT